MGWPFLLKIFLCKFGLAPEMVPIRSNTNPIRNPAMKRLLIASAVTLALAACGKSPQDSTTTTNIVKPGCSAQANADGSVTQVCVPSAADLDAVQAKVTELTNEIANINTRINNLPATGATDLTAVNAAIAAAQAHLAALDSAVSGINATAANQASALTALRNAIDTLTASLSAVATEAAATSVDTAKLKSDMAMVNAKTASLDTRLTAVETAVAGLSATVGNIQTQLNNVVTDASNLLARVAVLESAGPADLTAINADIAGLKTVMAGIQAAVSTLQGTTADQSTTIANLVASVTAINSQLATLAGQVAGGGSVDITQLQTDLATLQTQAIAANGRISTLETLVNGMVLDPIKQAGAINGAAAVYAASPSLDNAQGKIVWTLNNAPLSDAELFTLNFKTGFLKADAGGNLDLTGATGASTVDDRSISIFMQTATNDVGYKYPRRRLTLVTKGFDPAQNGVTQKLMLFAGVLNSDVLDFENVGAGLTSAAVTAGSLQIDTNAYPSTLKRRDWNPLINDYEYVDCAGSYAYNTTRTDVLHLDAVLTSAGLTCNPVSSPSKIILYKSDTVETFVYQ